MKTKECQSYTLNALRNAYKAHADIEAEIQAKIVETAKDLLEGKGFEVDYFAGSFRAYEMITERYEKAIEAYEIHQERHECAIPADIEEMY